ncbi:MAG: PAS domain S-box protein [Chitinophagaceae bacterium]|nr:PAS domain S-box protein [Chitinophagaceae bacterium]
MNKFSDQHPILPAWQELLDACQAGLFLIDRDFNIRWVNEYARRFRGRTCNEAEIEPGVPFISILPDARVQEVELVLQRVINGETISYHVPYKCLDESVAWVSVSYSTIRDDAGDVVFICITLFDISDLKRNELAVHESEQRWKSALEGAGNGVWEHNFQTGRTFFSSYYKKMLGYNESEFSDLRKSWQNIIHPDDRKLVESIDHSYQTGKIDNHAIEYRLKNSQGGYTWVLDTGMLLERDDNGRPIRLIGTTKDISLRKEAQEQLLASEERFISFMDHSPTMTWIMDEHHVYHYINEVYKKTFNITNEVVGRSLYDLFPKEMCEVFVRNNMRVWEEGRALEVQEYAQGPNGEVLTLQIFKFPLKTENGVRMLGGVGLDITDKVMTEKILAEERERNKRALIQGIIDAQEKERDELAYALHENVNQVLTSAKLMLEFAAEKPELGHEFVQRSLPYISEAITELRSLSHGLRPATLNDISLEAAIVEAVQAANNKGKVRVAYSYKNTGMRRQVPADIQLVLLRTAQEQLSNTIKHAAAKNAEVYLQLDDELVTLEVRDNGRGFDTRAQGHGVGLNNIINRVEFHKRKMDHRKQTRRRLPVTY